MSVPCRNLPVRLANAFRSEPGRQEGQAQPLGTTTQHTGQTVLSNSMTGQANGTRDEGRNAVSKAASDRPKSYPTKMDLGDRIAALALYVAPAVLVRQAFQ